MPFYDILREIDEFEAPWGRNVKLEEVALPGGMTFLRVRIREGKRFTDLELSPEVASRLGGALVSWGSSGGHDDEPEKT